MKYLTRIILLFILAAGCIPVTGADTALSGDTAPGYIIVTNPPVADFFTSNRYGSGPFTVSFADGTRGAEPMTWHWDFGDGTTSDIQNPAHTYGADGEYAVSLTATNQYGSDTKTMPAYIGVGNPPEAEFSVVPQEGDTPLSVQFTDVSTRRPATWKWDFGDGTVSAEQNPGHTYTTADLYTVTLSVSNNFGSSKLAKSGYIRVTNPQPVLPAGPSVAEKKRPEGIIGLIQQAKGMTQKNLPTGNLIPPQFLALAAVLTSMAVIIVQILVANIGALSQIALKFVKFFADLAGGHAVEKLSEKEIAARKIQIRRLDRHVLGLSASEILIIEVAVIMVALAFILADRAELTLQIVLIYIAVGACSVVLHDFAHRYFATKHGHDADTRFWGLGTVIMFLTAWLYGNAFAQSYRNIVNRNGEENAQETGIEMVSGPVVSIILMGLFLGMSWFGGIWAVAGGIGFTINLITAVYSLMPIETMDGRGIWRWNRAVYLLLFIPMILFYFFTYMIV
jgi:hypothetical protein